MSYLPIPLSPLRTTITCLTTYSQPSLLHTFSCICHSYSPNMCTGHMLLISASTFNIPHHMNTFFTRTVIYYSIHSPRSHVRVHLVCISFCSNSLQDQIVSATISHSMQHALYALSNHTTQTRPNLIFFYLHHNPAGKLLLPSNVHMCNNVHYLLRTSLHKLCKSK